MAHSTPCSLPPVESLLPVEMDSPREGVLVIPKASAGPQAAEAKGPRLHTAFLLLLIPSEKVAKRTVTVEGAAS